MPRSARLPYRLTTIRLWSSAGLLAMLMGLVANGELLIPEQNTLAYFATLRSPLAETVMLTLTWAGSSLILGPILLAVSAILLYRRQVEQALLIGITFFGAALNTWLLKILFARERPELFTTPLATLPPDAAFPSGHATHAAAAALGVWLVCRHRPWSLPLAAALAMLAVAVGLSRLYLQVHWPSDVVGGYLMAGIWALIALGATETYRMHQEQPQ